MMEEKRDYLEEKNEEIEELKYYMNVNSKALLFILALGIVYELVTFFSNSISRGSLSFSLFVLAMGLFAAISYEHFAIKFKEIEIMEMKTEL